MTETNINSFYKFTFAAVTAAMMATASASAIAGGSTIGTRATLTLNAVDPKAISISSPTIRSSKGKIVLAGGSTIGTRARLTLNAVASNGLHWNSTSWHRVSVDHRPSTDSGASRLVAQNGKLVILTR